MRGVGHLRIGNGLTATTTVSTIDGCLPNSHFSIKNNQSAFSFNIISDNSNIILKDKRSVELNKAGQELFFEVNGDGVIVEIGRDFPDRIVGTATISGGSTSVAVTFAGAGWFDEPDTSYKVALWVDSISGAPAAGAYASYATAIATSGFTINTPTAPGVGTSVTYGWEAVRLAS
jgi:hypothetical protein